MIKINNEVVKNLFNFIMENDNFSQQKLTFDNMLIEKQNDEDVSAELSFYYKGKKFNIYVDDIYSEVFIQTRVANPFYSSCGDFNLVTVSLFNKIKDKNNYIKILDEYINWIENGPKTGCESWRSL